MISDKARRELHKKGVRLIHTGSKHIDGIDMHRPTIELYVPEKKPLHLLRTEEILPSKVEDIETDIHELPEELKALIFLEPPETMAISDHRIRHRPCPGGISAIVYNSSACTLGGWHVKTDGQIVGMTNAHCNMNPVTGQQMGVGTHHIQPSPIDQGHDPTDFYAQTFDYEIENEHMDACMLHPISPVYIPEQFELGTVIGYEDPQVGEEIFKSGRTSGITSGTIAATDASATINYGPIGNKTKLDLVLVQSPMLQGGDSGDEAYKKTDTGLLYKCRGFAGGGGNSLFLKYPYERERFSLAHPYTGQPTTPGNLRVTIDQNAPIAGSKVIVESA